ncbi:unnamed protein product [Mytilus edulis]|uniref:Uncharacterized protein n=1 Tax=Mytilus edulis TaxID=6550 RepID=A0A8S3RCW9_MYTED|nr:unnamed protein product [Mytilus edulis]
MYRTIFKAVSSSTKTVIEMKTELKLQSHKIVELEAEKQKLQQDIDHLKDVQRGHNLDSSNEELKRKTEYIDTLEQQYKEVVKLNKNLLERSKEDRQLIKEDRKEREMDRKEREEDRKQRLMDMEQMKKDREQRDMGMKMSEELITKMDLMLSRLEQHDMTIDQNETSGTNQPPTPRPNIAYNLRKNNNCKKNNNSK